MNTDVALAMTNQMLWTAMTVTAPVLGITLIVGLVISILQAVTQIQEMTLTFVPKLLVVVLVIFFLGHWMLTTLVNYTIALFHSIPSLV